MDQLHFDLWVDGENILCDAGTYSYASDDGRKLVLNESHNTAVVKDTPQMNKFGTFMIFDWTDREFGKVNGEKFNGIVVSKNGYTHKRNVEITKKGFVITDQVSMDSYIIFHTPCEVDVIDNKAVLKVEKTANAGKTVKIKCDRALKISDSMRSLFYLKSEKTKCIAIKAKADEKIRTFIEILYA